MIAKTFETTDGHALERLVNSLYSDLYGEVQSALERGMEGRAFLDPEASVNACYDRLRAGVDRVGMERMSFFALAARVIRHVLVTSLRGRSQGPTEIQILAPSDLFPPEVGTLEFGRMNAALTRLSVRNLRLSRLVELRLFSGLTCREAAAVLGLDPERACQDWDLASSYLAPTLVASRTA